MTSYEIITGERLKIDVEAPCGIHNGRYVQDYSYQEGSGDLDECNGRFGVTMEYPQGTYYYMITSSYPILPPCLRLQPDDSFIK